MLFQFPVLWLTFQCFCNSWLPFYHVGGRTIRRFLVSLERIKGMLGVSEESSRRGGFLMGMFLDEGISLLWVNFVVHLFTKDYIMSHFVGRGSILEDPSFFVWLSDEFHPKRVVLDEKCTSKQQENHWLQGQIYCIFLGQDSSNTLLMFFPMLLK